MSERGVLEGCGLGFGRGVCLRGVVSVLQAAL